MSERRSRAFWVGLAIGWVVIGFGLVGLLRDSAVTKPAALARWFVGSGLAHDAVVAPIAVAIGWLTLRVVPERARVPVRLALAASALLIAFTWPYVRGYGETEANPSVLFLDYGRNLVVGLVVIWTAAAVSVVVTGRTSGRDDARR